MAKILQKLILLFIFPACVFQYLGCASNFSDVPVSKIPGNAVSGTPTEKLNEIETNSVKNPDPELEKNRRLWKGKNITNYDFTASLYKGGNYRWAEPVLIKVRNGQTISIEILDEKYKAVPIEEAIGGYRQLDTVEKVFDYIQKGLDGDADVEVKYDKKFGYPTQMSVNYLIRGSDQFQFMKIRKFEIVNNE